MNPRITRSIFVLLLIATSGVAQTTAEEYYQLGIESLRLRDFESALLHFDKAIDVDPKYAPVYNSRGRIRGSRRNYTGAIADHTAAIELEPKKPGGYSERALMHLYNSEFDAAIADYSKVIELGGNKRVAYFFTGEAYEHKAVGLIQNGQTEAGRLERAKAIAAYTKSIATASPADPTYTLAYSYRSNCHARNGDYDKALADIDFALSVKPNFVDDLRRRLEIYRATGRTALAEADEQKIFELTGKRPN